MEINSAIAERARDGALLTEAELLELDSADVLSLGMLADEVRRARTGDVVTFSRVLEVGASGLPAGESADAALAGASEVRLTALGETLADTVAAVAAVRARVGSNRRVVGFSLGDLVARHWGTPVELAEALRAAGLDALAEAPIDRVSADAVAETAGAGLAPQVLSVEQHAEGSAACVARIVRFREIAARVPLTTRVAPLARQQSVTVPTTGYQDVRMVALSRLGLPGIAGIEVDWQQYGPKLSQVALMFGASHLDRVSPVDDAALGPRRASAEEVRRNIAAAGYRPAEPGEAA